MAERAKNRETPHENGKTTLKMLKRGLRKSNSKPKMVEVREAIYNTSISYGQNT